MEKFYPTDMTDEQWELIRSWLPPDKKTGRPRTTDLRAVGARTIFERLGAFPERLRRLIIVWVDGTYDGEEFREWTKKTYYWILETIKRSDDVKGFKLLPKRWVVERTWGWLNWSRRLSKDYEVLPETSETFIYIAMIRIMLRRLA